MSGSKRYSPEVSFETILARHLRNPEVRRAYDELEPEFEIVRQIVDLRIKRRMTQAQLAKRVGTAQPDIARLENRRRPSKEIDLLRRVANALDAKLEVRLVPREARGAKERAGGPSAHRWLRTPNKCPREAGAPEGTSDALQAHRR